MARKILIVEDEQIVAEDIRKSLQHLGYTVRGIAPAGKEALCKVEEELPDLALVDIVLKGDMDGIEVARRMRSQFNIPVVYLTAYDDEKTLNRARTTEPYGYLLKPYKERELHTTIEMALYKHGMEKKVEENLQRLVTTLTSIGHGVITTDMDGLVTFMNPVAEELTGWDHSHAVGTVLQQVFHTVTDSGESKDIISEVFKKGTITVMVSHTLISKNGATFPITATAAPLRGDQGIVTGAVVVFSNIIEQKEMEEALKESEARYRALFDRSVYCVFVHDFEGDFLDANNAALTLLGYTREEIPSLSLASLIDEEQLPQVVTIMEEIKKHGFRTQPAQYKLKKKNGSYVWVETEASLIYRQGKPYAIQGIARDITERRRAEMELKKLFEASKLINSTMNMEEIFEFISDSIKELVDFDYFVIFLVKNGHVYAAYSEGIAGSIEPIMVPSGEWVIGQCIENKESMFLENAPEPALHMPGVTQQGGSEIAVPLVVEDECVGALYIFKSAPGVYEQKDVNVLRPFSEVVASAIENSRLYHEVHELNRELEERIAERSRRMEIILNTKQDLQAETSWEKGLQIIVESMEKIGFERCGVFLVDPLRKTLDAHVRRGVQVPRPDVSISLKNTEYFGVTCVLKKRTIHVKDFSTVEGKQVTSESNSFVWVPIIVQDEAFAALAADNVESGRVCTEEDVRDLEILAGMCAAFIDRTRILVEPVAEKSLHTKLKFRLDFSETYLIKEKKPEKSFEIFIDFVTHGIPGFMVSRTYPEKVKRHYRLQKTPMLWLSNTQVDNAIDPNDLSKLIFIIEDFTKKSEHSVVLLDGLEYLITQTDFEGVSKFLHELKDMIVLNNALLLVPLHKDALSVREYSVLERDLIVLDFG
ncbi:MAG: PAS domain S-box protein [Theionarchaea archaeon]|nr:PAS domain S-box protein [Theionarchaea archaeon]